MLYGLNAMVKSYFDIQLAPIFHRLDALELAVHGTKDESESKSDSEAPKKQWGDYDDSDQDGQPPRRRLSPGGVRTKSPVGGRGKGRGSAVQTPKSKTGRGSGKKTPSENLV